jgi:putative endonuclease
MEQNNLSNCIITLYVIYGISTGKKYIGITNNLQRRLNEHRNSNTKGSQIIGEFKLIHTEKFDDYRTARKREIFLKSGQGRQWLNNNIKTRPTRGG